MKHIYTALLTTTILSLSTILGAGRNNLVEGSSATDGCSSTKTTYAAAVQLLSNPSDEAYTQARRLLESVVDSKDPAVLQDLGIMLYLGLGGNEDIQRGINLLEESADLGSKVAQDLLITVCKIGVKVPVDKKRSGYWAGRFNNNISPAVNSSPLEDKFFEFSVQFGKEVGICASGGDQDTELKMGLIMLTSKGSNALTDTDYQWLEKAAKKGNLEAQYFLGHYELMNCRYGSNNSKNLEWLEKAADSGHEKAMEILYKAYLMYPYIEHDYVKAKKYATMLYETGNDRGCGAMLFYHLQTQATSPSRNADSIISQFAKEVIQKSQKENPDRSVILLAATLLSDKVTLYDKFIRKVIKPDVAEYLRLTFLAANSKYATQNPLKMAAEIFEEGKYGQAKDIAKALHYYKKAALLGDKRAIEKVKQLSSM